MLKSIEIDVYSNGFNASKINCIDIPIAGATGCYNYENYFYYCFYYSMFLNWTDMENEDWLSFRNEILKRLGLRMIANRIDDFSQLISTIKFHIDNLHPLILIARYNSLFYYNSYLKMDYKASHGIIISGYETDKPIIVIRESVHIDKEIFNFLKVQSLSKFLLTENMLKDMWNITNISYKEENNPNYNIIYNIEKIEQPHISADARNNFARIIQVKFNSKPKMLFICH